MDSPMAEEMLTHAVHVGHKVSKWNPKMKPYLYGQQNGIHIFDLAQTVEKLATACAAAKKCAAEGKRILFVGTKPHAQMIVEEAAKRCAMPHITRKWIGGFFTNFATVSKRIRHLKNLKAEESSGGFEKYVKHEAVKKRKEIEKLEERFGGVQEMDRLPAMIVVADSVHDRLPIKEAHDMKIPVVAIADSNADPDLITYMIPGNDDALSSLTYIIGKITEAIEEGKSAPKATHTP